MDSAVTGAPYILFKTNALYKRRGEPHFPHYWKSPHSKHSTLPKSTSRLLQDKMVLLTATAMVLLSLLVGGGAALEEAASFATAPEMAVDDGKPLAETMFFFKALVDEALKQHEQGGYFAGDGVTGPLLNHSELGAIYRRVAAVNPTAVFAAQIAKVGAECDVSVRHCCYHQPNRCCLQVGEELLQVSESSGLMAQDPHSLLSYAHQWVLELMPKLSAAAAQLEHREPAMAARQHQQPWTHVSHRRMHRVRGDRIHH